MTVTIYHNPLCGTSRGALGEPDQRKVQWTFRPANAAAAHNQMRREAGTDHQAQGPI
jgi:arsenate reductase-like glutaredoxin family protein